MAEWLGFCASLPERGSTQSKPAVWRSGIYEVAPRRGPAAGDEIIGRGGFANVYTASMICEGDINLERKRVAIKYVTRNDEQKQLFREMHILRELGRQNPDGHRPFRVNDVVEARIGDEGRESWETCTVLAINSDGAGLKLLRKAKRTAEGELVDEDEIANVHVSLVRFASSPYIIAIIDAFSENYPPNTAERPKSLERLNLTFELMAGDLKSLIKNEEVRPFLRMDEIRLIMYQILAGMHYVHSAGIMHRDLKPENIFYTIDSSGRFLCKISDFGFSRCINEEVINRQLRGTSSRSLAQVQTSNVFTIWYRPPEVILFNSLRDPYSRMVDMWSIGCIFADLLHVQQENLEMAGPCILCKRPGSKAYYQIENGLNINPEWCADCSRTCRDRRGVYNAYRRPLMPGTWRYWDATGRMINDDRLNYDNPCTQLLLGIDLIGKPTEEEVSKYYRDTPDIVRLKSLRVDGTKYTKKNYATIFPGTAATCPDALDLIDRLLVFDPEQRWPADRCIREHPYFAEHFAGKESQREYSYQEEEGTTLLDYVGQMRKENVQSLLPNIVRELDIYHAKFAPFAAAGGGEV